MRLPSGLRSGAFAALALAVSMLAIVPVGNCALVPAAAAGGRGARGQAGAVGGPLSAAFQSSFAPASLALRPASCGPQPGVCVGRAPSARGVLTLVSQYRGRGRGGRLVRPPQNKGPPMNDKIPFPEMRVVVANADGKDDMLGVMSKDEALARAEDLVPCAPAPLRPSVPARACAVRRQHARTRARAGPPLWHARRPRVSRRAPSRLAPRVSARVSEARARSPRAGHGLGGGEPRRQAAGVQNHQLRQAAI